MDATSMVGHMLTLYLTILTTWAIAVGLVAFFYLIFFLYLYYRIKNK